MPLPKRQDSIKLMEQYIQDPALRNHCLMVAQAMEGYAQQLDQDVELWFAAGLLHDLDWEQFPDQHPQKALDDLLDDYPDQLKQAVAAHAPQRTQVQAESLLDRYLFACDEICGLMNAIALVRPNRFSDMKVKSINKKLKDKAFAANVSRKDIKQGLQLINKEAAEHFQFLIEVFRNWS